MRHVYYTHALTFHLMLTHSQSLHHFAVCSFDRRLSFFFVIKLNEAVTLVQRHSQHLAVGLEDLHNILAGHSVRGQVSYENAGVHHLWVRTAGVTTLAVVDLLKSCLSRGS